jgi:hypothetical protein
MVTPARWERRNVNYKNQHLRKRVSFLFKRRSILFPFSFCLSAGFAFDRLFSVRLELERVILFELWLLNPYFATLDLDLDRLLLCPSFLPLDLQKRAWFAKWALQFSFVRWFLPYRGCFNVEFLRNAILVYYRGNLSISITFFSSRDTLLVPVVFIWLYDFLIDLDLFFWPLFKKSLGLMLWYLSLLLNLYKGFKALVKSLISNAPNGLTLLILFFLFRYSLRAWRVVGSLSFKLFSGIHGFILK